MYSDNLIFELIKKETERQKKSIELIASENYVSDEVLLASGSTLTNKYAEGYPKKRYYEGCQIVDQIEILAIERLKELFNANWANVQPHSGSQANAAVMFALLNPGDKILGLSLDSGGHLTHGTTVSFSGRFYQGLAYNLDLFTETVDYKLLEEIAIKERPKLIICGASCYSRDWDYKKIRDIADASGSLVLADIAHTAGLIAKGLLNNPLKHCHVVTTTTHKTLRGPRGGAIMTGTEMTIVKNNKQEKISSLLDRAIFPGIQGGPLMHTIAAKAISFKEALSFGFKNYALQIKKNAMSLANSLMDLGYNISSNGTDNHLMLINLMSKNLTGAKAAETLAKVNIVVNKNKIPFDKQPPTITSGIRIGTPAITTRGLKENDMKTIAELIDKSLRSHDNACCLSKIKNEVENFIGNYPFFTWQ